MSESETVRYRMHVLNAQETESTQQYLRACLCAPAAGCDESADIHAGYRVQREFVRKIHSQGLRVHVRRERRTREIAAPRMHSKDCFSFPLLPLSLVEITSCPSSPPLILSNRLLPCSHILSGAGERAPSRTCCAGQYYSAPDGHANALPLTTPRTPPRSSRPRFFWGRCA